MEKLNGDLVTEIFSHLPVKDATRCKILNKTFYSHIFDQNFEHKYFTEANIKVCDQVYFTYWYPSDYHRINLNPLKPTKYSRKMDTTSTPINEFPTLASCGGLLLLDLKDIKTYCVVNPISQEYQLVPHHTDETDDWSNGSCRLIGREIGLAVDLSKDGSYRCTVVAVDAENQVLKFKLFTCGSNTWEDIHEQVLACKLFNRLDTRNTQPNYLNGSMHWLTRNGDILCFDLEKHRARIIERPIKEPCFMVSNWFGGVKDSLVYAHALEYEIVAYVYNHANAKWEIQHKVRNLYTTLDHNYIRGSIKLFNGERLLFLLGNRNENGEIYSQDISSDQTWKNVGLTEESVDYSLQFIPFVPTFARLSTGLYLHDRTTEGSLDSGVKETLIGLCKIFREDFDFNWRELLFS